LPQVFLSLVEPLPDGRPGTPCRPDYTASLGESSPSVGGHRPPAGSSPNGLYRDVLKIEADPEAIVQRVMYATLPERLVVQ
jgi:hypothetical protein